MGSTGFIEDIWSKHYLLLKKESTAFSHDICFVALLLFSVARTQHLLMRDGVHNIFSREMTYNIITQERWSLQHLFLLDGLHNSYS